MRKLLLLVNFLCLGALLQAQTWSPTWASLDQRPVPQWFKSDYAYVIRIKNTGAFAPRPAITVSYPPGALHPLITIRAHEGTAWHYTLDSTAPSPAASRYTGPFTIQRSATLKVQAFQQGILPGGIAIGCAGLHLVISSEGHAHQPVPENYFYQPAK